MELKGKKVTVVGIGNSGLNAALLLKDSGADVRVTDSRNAPEVKEQAKRLKEKGIVCEVGGHTEDFIKGSALVVLSPGVEPSSGAVRYAEKFGVPVIGEMELGYLFCKGRIIAITGTNGKSTVTTLIGQMLKDAGENTVVCGNIGNSLCGEISRIKEDTWVVLEVSSFQLESMREFRPHVAIILNITDDHQDRYRSFKDYFDEKLKIFRNQDKKDFLILNYDADNLRSLKDKAASKVLFYSVYDNTRDAYIEGGSVKLLSGRDMGKVFDITDMKLKGSHNVENVLASCLAASIAGVKMESMRNTISRFTGLPHRFETVGTIDGVEYIDDSKGTTVDSTCRALESCDRAVILIAGGRDKNSDYSVIKQLAKEKIESLILIGEARHKIKSVLSDVVQVREAETMQDAVALAHKMARAGSVVLLSPMCSSFDMFRDYKHRGDVFKEAVKNLRTSCKSCAA
ncbi:MAG: UDP-N-acetylmuramoyl-L-alanine--D-glutamate ligase [Candidatus Omnitrophica bacterium]|nr:UDP-N-acetylmuramoyl-L-alanine--D-glutamate ligase [Candidatus Omnitrophota bacterium]